MIENYILKVNGVLKTFGIDKRNIYSYTSDNGANFLCLGKSMQKLQGILMMRDEIEQARLQLFEEDESSDEENDLENLEIDEDDEAEIEDPISLDFWFGQISYIMSIIRCACHSLQLAVYDAIKGLGINNEINDIRKIVKNLKASKYNDAFKKAKLKKPKINVCTRWNSLYMMFNELILNRSKFRELYKYISTTDVSSVYFTEKHWNFMVKFCDAFKVAYVCTQKMQSQNLNMGINIYLVFINFL